MGNKQSVRSTHFQPPNRDEQAQDDIPEDHHISISNKMVERLVEDATLAGGAASANDGQSPPRDYKDKIFMEKLTCLDDNHTEKLGLTVDDLKATTRRIELRTANMVSVEPVCADCQENVIACYNTVEDPKLVVKCWDTVGAFTKCVQDATTSRLRARTHKEAREHARRTRHVAHAREHALRDLGPEPPDRDQVPSDS